MSESAVTHVTPFIKVAEPILQTAVAAPVAEIQAPAVDATPTAAEAPASLEAPAPVAVTDTPVAVSEPVAAEQPAPVTTVDVAPAPASMISIDATKAKLMSPTQTRTSNLVGN